MTYLVKLGNPVGALFGLLTAWLVGWWAGAPEGARAMTLAAGLLVVVDTLLGSIVGIKRRHFRSARVGDAILKVLVYALAVVACMAIDYGLQLSYWALITVAGLIFYRETVSVLENLKRLGFPIPAVLEKVQGVFHPEGEDTDAQP